MSFAASAACYVSVSFEFWRVYVCFWLCLMPNVELATLCGTRLT